MRILFISSFTPRKCGIATFCRDLIQGIKSNNPATHIEVAAMVDELSEDLDYPPEVAFRIRQRHWEDYQHLVHYLNHSNRFDLVCLQHEYGIYGGRAGEFIARFLDDVDVPVVTTLHTVLPEPTPTKKEILQRIGKDSARMVIMLEKGVKILQNQYGLSPHKSSIIPHGVPTFSHKDHEQLKKKLGLEGKIVLSSVNLLSPVKGVEYAIKALPQIPTANFIYLIIGETHPSKLKGQPEDLLRKRLMALVKKLGVEEKVQFINRYLPVEELVEYIIASDLYITPYLDPQQATSGALSYALGAGKVVISTPYLYAKEMIGKGAGIIVPFRDAQAIAHAVIKVSENPNLKRELEIQSKRIGEKMSWSSVGAKYLQLFTEVIQEANNRYKPQTDFLFD